MKSEDHSFILVVAEYGNVNKLIGEMIRIFPGHCELHLVQDYHLPK